MQGLKTTLRLPRTASWAKNVYWMFGFEVLPEFKIPEMN